MKKYVKILNAVVCTDEIQEVYTQYNLERYRCSYVHKLVIRFKDGTAREYISEDHGADKEAALDDFENLKKTLLNLDATEQDAEVEEESTEEKVVPKFTIVSFKDEREALYIDDILLLEDYQLQATDVLNALSHYLPIIVEKRDISSYFEGGEVPKSLKSLG